MSTRSPFFNSVENPVSTSASRSKRGSLMPGLSSAAESRAIPKVGRVVPDEPFLRLIRRMRPTLRRGRRLAPRKTNFAHRLLEVGRTAQDFDFESQVVTRHREFFPGLDAHRVLFGGDHDLHPSLLRLDEDAVEIL